MRRFILSRPTTRLAQLRTNPKAPACGGVHAALDCVKSKPIEGSFTIIDIYESVHSVRFLMTPSPKAYAKMLIFFSNSYLLTET